jgi:hypothetical protein
MFSRVYMCGVVCPYALEYTDIFKEFDDGTGTVSAMDMESLIRRLSPPLGGAVRDCKPHGSTLKFDHGI